MRSIQRSPAWPYLGVLACIIVLCFATTRRWQPVGESSNPSPADSRQALRSGGTAKPPVSNRVPGIEDLEWDRSPVFASAQSEAVRQSGSAGDSSSPQVGTPQDIELAISWPRREVADSASEPPATDDAAGSKPQEHEAQPIEANPLAEADRPDDSEGGKDGTRIEQAPAPEPPASVSPVRVSSENDRLAMRSIVRRNIPSNRLKEPAPSAEPLESSDIDTGDGAHSSQKQWHLAESLQARFCWLAQQEATRGWAETMLEALRPIDASRPITASEPQFSQVQRLLEEAGPLAARCPERTLRREVLRARHAVQRRLDVWTALADASSEPGRDRHAISAHAELLRQLDQVAALTTGRANGGAWKEYLMLDVLRRAATRRQPPSLEQRKQLAAATLARIDTARRMHPENVLFRSPELQTLDGPLHRWSSDPVNRGSIAARLEQFEQTGSSHIAAQLASDMRRLTESAQPAERELGRKLQQHYRNANLRIALAKDLLMRFLPQESARAAPVRDRILGADVRGRSHTTTRLDLRFLPHPAKLRVAIDAHGLVQTQTCSLSGPAIFHSSGCSDYLATKPVEVDREQMHVGMTRVRVDAASALLGVSTEYDDVPLLGSLVQSVAKSKHEDSRSEALAITESRIGRQIARRVDQQAEAALAKAQRKFDERVWARLQDLQLQPEVIALQTTEDRLIARLRVADETHLASHTPRPLAPSDSLLSLQFHESALNNVVQQLELDGQSFTLPELHTHVAEKLKLKGSLPEDSPRDLKLTFAPKDSVRFRFEDGRIRISVALAELVQGDGRYRDFTVQAFYTPGVEGLRARLARRDVVRLQGRRIRFGSQIVLRGIFSRIFSEKHPHQLISERMADDPRLEGLEVTQLEIVDGWIGLAIGPERREKNNVSVRAAGLAE